MNEFDKYEPRKPLSKEQKQARKELRATEAKVAMAEHENAAEHSPKTASV
jgi:hypothetical protein